MIRLLAVIVALAGIARCAGSQDFVVLRYDLPWTSATLDGIAFSDFQTTSPDGKVEPLRPEIRQFEFSDRKYVAAIDNGLIGPSNAPTVRIWVYLLDEQTSEWRCFYFTRFEGALAVDCELDASSWVLRIFGATNNRFRGVTLATLDLRVVPRR